MSFARSFSNALYRSIDQAKHSFASAIRMDVLPPTASSHGRKLIYSINSESDLGQLATGCDSDMGGMSKMQLALDNEEQKGRFFGTLSTEVPPNAKLERSGYAAFRNRNRPTLFGAQTWDTTMHPYLRLRVRNRLAASPSTSESSQNPSPRIHSATTSSSVQSPNTYTRAVHALGLNKKDAPGPKFFLNLQTDGPVVSDLFQHRIFLDERKGNAWQDVIIPLSNFILINTGQVAEQQIQMMREKLRTVGISVVLESPLLGDVKPPGGGGESSAPNVLKSHEAENDANSGVRGARRGMKYNFDLGIDHIEAISEEALTEEGIRVE